MRKTMLLVLIALFGNVGGASAGLPTYQFVVVPAVPTAEESIQIAVSVGPMACNRLPPSLGVQVLRDGVIRFGLAGSDACEPNLPAQQQTYAVGGLPAGQYTFRFAMCAPFLIGGQSCLTLSEQMIVIAGAFGASQSVPTGSLVGLVVLAMLLLVLGARSIRA